jgi:hypothetical protein
MLAQSFNSPASCGTIGKDVHGPDTFRTELLAFIANQLPRWRDDPMRPASTSEDALTEHLCDYLTGAARLSQGWDVVQFRTATIDEAERGRKIDLTAKPCGVTLVIDGRNYTQYESILPIECKRLPTPDGAKRDHREYVFNKHGTTGGVQRFKACHHGAKHSLGAMIAYVQEESASLWHKHITEWIAELVAAAVPDWSSADHLQADRDDPVLGLAIFRSVHARTSGYTPIQICHLWLRMN